MTFAPAGTPGGSPAPGLAGRLSWQRRRQLPLLAVGVLLVAGCALLFTLVAGRGPAGTQVLVASRPLPAGHVLSAADLSTATLRGPRVASIPAGGEAGVLGRPLALPVAAGALLLPADVGSASGLAAGSAVVALALKPGQYPPMVGTGDRVEILNTATDGANGGANGGANDAAATGGAVGQPVPAIVLAVDPQPEGSAVAVVASVQVAAGQASAVAAMGAAGTGSLVLLAPGASGP